MASAKDPYSILNKDPERGRLKPQYDPSVRVARYRPNAVPKCPQEDSQEPALLTAVKSPAAIAIDSTNFRVSDLTALPEAHPIAPLVRTEPEESEDSEEMYESEDYEEVPARPMFKPVFVEKGLRVTETEAEIREGEEEETQRELQRLSETRRAETQRIISEALVQEAQEVNSDPEQIPDDDDPGDPEEYKKWKVREIKRMIRAREERSARQKELAEIERRRNLSDWERQEEDLKLGTDATAKPERKPMMFMQKWAHAGAFFQDRDESGRLDSLFMRDINAPVEGDFDKSTLPAVLQKRRGNFGQKGQSKWTHLTEEDTTDFNPAFMPDEKLVMKQQLKQGGFKSMNQFSHRRPEE